MTTKSLPSAIRAVSLVLLLPAVALLSAGSTFAAEHKRVSVRNELPVARASETIEIQPPGDLALLHVFDGEREVLSQGLDLDGNGTFDSLVFQTDLGPNQEKTFEVRAGEKRVYRKDDFRVYGRFVRERHDDFAWENDRVAHRMYGAALETWQREPLTSSTVDVWLKRTRRLVINDWYMVDDYHRDHGEGADFFSAGRSRGCGGSGLWREGKLVVSNNFRESKVLANGPIRLVFELRYPGFGTKRITLDAGHNFNKFEETYEAPWAAGLKKSAQFRTETGWIRAWGPVAGNGNGNFGCAVIVLDPAPEVVEADNNHLIVAKGPAVFWVGSAWDKSGDFKGVDDFDSLIAEWARRVKNPVKVRME
jgi:Domain of unknown function (DUF4861)